MRAGEACTLRLVRNVVTLVYGSLFSWRPPNNSQQTMAAHCDTGILPVRVVETVLGTQATAVAASDTRNCRIWANVNNAPGRSS